MTGNKVEITATEILIAVVTLVAVIIVINKSYIFSSNIANNIKNNNYNCDNNSNNDNKRSTLLCYK